jgi:hypothetical protein
MSLVWGFWTFIVRLNELPLVMLADEGDGVTVKSEGDTNSSICDVESTLPAVVVPRA